MNAGMVWKDAEAAFNRNCGHGLNRSAHVVPSLFPVSGSSKIREESPELAVTHSTVLVLGSTEAEELACRFSRLGMRFPAGNLSCGVSRNNWGCYKEILQHHFYSGSFFPPTPEADFLPCCPKPINPRACSSLSAADTAPSPLCSHPCL